VTPITPSHDYTYALTSHRQDSRKELRIITATTRLRLSTALVNRAATALHFPQTTTHAALHTQANYTPFTNNTVGDTNIYKSASHSAATSARAFKPNFGEADCMASSMDDRDGDDHKKEKSRKPGSTAAPLSCASRNPRPAAHIGFSSRYCVPTAALKGLAVSGEPRRRRRREWWCFES
jgi:hypothetical protein